MYNTPVIEDNKIKCEICGEFFATLHAHISKTHKTAISDYIKNNNYNPWSTLTTPRVTKALVTNGKQARETARTNSNLKFN